MKKLPAFMLLLFISVTIPAKSSAEMYDGNALLEDCNQVMKYLDNKEDPSLVMSSIGFCLGYMQGHIDFQQRLEKDPVLKIGHCFPMDISVTRLAKTVVQFLERNPDKLHRPAMQLALAAFAESYPCTYKPIEIP